MQKKRYGFFVRRRARDNICIKSIEGDICRHFIITRQIINPNANCLDVTDINQENVANNKEHADKTIPLHIRQPNNISNKQLRMSEAQHSNKLHVSNIKAHAIEQTDKPLVCIILGRVLKIQSTGGDQREEQKQEDKFIDVDE
jgi:hypothetical protein